LQRLFSSFADGWPGLGLLLQRLVAGVALFYCGITYIKTPEIIGAVGGTLLLIGLWTPLAGALVAIVELWIALAGGGNPSIPIILAALGASLAMVGPGAWSIDARLFGRKHITPRNL
jgi:putative oxidoreductase